MLSLLKAVCLLSTSKKHFKAKLLFIPLHTSFSWILTLELNEQYFHHQNASTNSSKVIDCTVRTVLLFWNDTTWWKHLEGLCFLPICSLHLSLLQKVWRLLLHLQWKHQLGPRLKFKWRLIASANKAGENTELVQGMHHPEKRHKKDGEEEEGEEEEEEMTRDEEYILTLQQASKLGSRGGCAILICLRIYICPCSCFTKKQFCIPRE